MSIKGEMTMKAKLLSGVFLSMLAIDMQAGAVVWELDRPTALQFRTYENIMHADDWVGRLDIYDGPGNEVYDGGGVTSYPSMSGVVGFTSETFGDGPDVDNVAMARIYDPDPDLSDDVAYDGVTCCVHNDGEHIWTVQLFYNDPGDGVPYRTSGFYRVAPGECLRLTAQPYSPGRALDLDKITRIGIHVMGHINHGIAPDPDTLNPKNGDTFRISIGPVNGCDGDEDNDGIPDVVEDDACLGTPPGLFDEPVLSLRWRVEESRPVRSLCVSHRGSMARTGCDQRTRKGRSGI